MDEDYKDKVGKAIGEIGSVIAFVTLMVLLILCFTSCKTSKQAEKSKEIDSLVIASDVEDSLVHDSHSSEVEKNDRREKDTIYISKVIKDSIYVRDSIAVTKGDTILVERWHNKYIEHLRIDTFWRERLVVDSSYYRYIYADSMSRMRVQIDSLSRVHIKTDSIAYPVYIEKNLTKWQSLKMRLGGWLMGVIAALVVCSCAYIIYKVRVGGWKNLMSNRD